jgi:hypothetical protein
MYRSRRAAYEAELANYARRPAGQFGPKHPPTPEHLQAEIDHHRGLEEHWTRLAQSYEAEALAKTPAAGK